MEEQSHVNEVSVPQYARDTMLAPNMPAPSLLCCVYDAGAVLLLEIDLQSLHQQNCRVVSEVSFRPRQQSIQTSTTCFMSVSFPLS